MKKRLAILVSIIMITLFTNVCAEEPAIPTLTQDVVVLFTSDVHCGIDQGFGYTGLAAIRDELAKSNHVVLVDNGDAIQGEPVGTMTTGEALIKLMNSVRYDVAIPGNHEFDYGTDRFLYLADTVAQFPYISTNFTHNGNKVFAPYIIKEFDGVKIAFVGVTTPKTFTSSTPKYFQDENGNYVYGFCEDVNGEALYNVIQEAVDAARSEGANYVILQAHLGIQAECSPWMSTDVIANTTGIDALLDGHSHSELTQEEVLNKNGKKVLLSACGTKLANIGYLRITKEGKLSTGLYTWKYDISFPALMGDTAVAKAVSAATDELNTKLAEIVATSGISLTITDPVTGVRIVRNNETNLGDLCADAYRTMADSDVAMVNGGGIRVSIDNGDITLGDILKVYPFGNALCKVEATGQQILDALEWASRDVPGECGGFLQVSGMTYEIHTYINTSVISDDKGNFLGVTGERRVRNVKIDGVPLDPERTYTVASHNYLVKNGGDGNNVFKNCKVLIDESMLDNQVIINYITKNLGGVIGEEYSNPYGQGRIIGVETKE